MAFLETAAFALIVVSRAVEAWRKYKNNDLSPPQRSIFGPGDGDSSGSDGSTSEAPQDRH